MFWKKKQVAAAPVAASGMTVAPGRVIPPLTQAAVPPKQKIEKLPGPQDIPELVGMGRHLVFAEKGIHTLRIETDESMAVAQARTRLGTFVEILRNMT